MIKRILVFTGYFHPHVGGLEISLLQLLTSLANNGHEITIVTCNTEHVDALENVNRLLVHRLPSWNILGGTYPVPKPTLYTFRILCRLSNADYELVQTNTRFFLTSLLGYIFSKLRKIPLIHVEMGSKHSVLSNRIIDCLSRIYDHTLGALVVKKARKVICHSHEAEQFLKHLGVKSKIVVIPTAGVDTELFSESKRKDVDAKKEIMELNRSLVITSVSRLIYAKGVQDLLSVFPKIKEQIPNIKVVIVGDGPYREYLENMASKIDPDCILFLGQIEHKDVAEVFSVTDILVHPSYSEALIAYPVLEAGAMGVPSVTTDAGGVCEVIEDGKTALIVPTGNTDDLAEGVIRLLGDENLRGEIGRRIRQLVLDKYSLEKVASAFTLEIQSL